MSGLARQLQVALRHNAVAWLAQDPDELTRAELQELIHAAGDVSPELTVIEDTDTSERARAWRELQDRFSARLAFGTAGLRGRLGAGPNRMNRVLVAQAARGFADFLLSREESPSIVVGYDARNNSKRFAEDTAEIMQAAGVAATILPRQLPTPVLAFAVRRLGASAGVMVTASHNPKWDNGYKVYLGGADDGSQIVAPVDAEIAAAIGAVAAGTTVPEIPRSTDYATADESIVSEYVSATASLLRGTPNDVRFVYTPLHGVGWETFRAVITELGVAEPVVVAQQVEPDGAFPTLDFPNPEEPGALDLAYETADAAGIDLVIAHDPDADRLAVAVKDAAGWRRFGGNDIGKILGWRAAEQAKADGLHGTLATSVVSAPALGRIAHEYGLDYAETPTGFKWISRAPNILYGYEEALGYLVNPETVHDKDGISASVAILELIMGLQAEGRTLIDHDDAFAERFGTFVSTQVSVRFDDITEIPRVMAVLRGNTPAEVGGVEVLETGDLSGDEVPIDLLRYQLADGTRVMVRPSGTEPKIKVYVDASSEDGSPAERAADAEAKAARAGEALRVTLTTA
ncbi:phospho-sugar mutase [Pseudoclavibacter sp. RFBA6]|uniref:phospho-sugar mutase n=1 Tax=Pseudoclavibacter sp. RFBA6 TaxID=2080573 RepID=UPI000CE8FD6D|nr:phospho-sugar mutase [Pseudoclavibacter sp. RFBA6]PPG42271.1 phosphomannomutase [Pseudoclavibacter sp. RFBA6]